MGFLKLIYIKQCDFILLVVKHVGLYFWSSTEVFVDLKKQKMSDLMIFSTIVLHIKWLSISRTFYLFFLDDRMVQETSKSQRCGKYVFYCFCDKCCPKWDFEKINIVWITRSQSTLSLSVVYFGLFHYREEWILIQILYQQKGLKKVFRTFCHAS